jgi:D-alanyl-D-alanine carboxypeptidase (penicillin-binding protein 5/6)
MTVTSRFRWILGIALLSLTLAPLSAAVAQVQQPKKPAASRPAPRAAAPSTTAKAAPPPADVDANGMPIIQTAAPFALLIDYDTGAVLLNKNGDKRMFPSSMTKMLTAYIVFDKLKKGDIKLDDELVVSERAWRTQGSKSFVPLGAHLKIEDLLRGVIIQSGNDACVVLAEGLAGSQEAFADEMNRWAKTLGLNDSNFRNPDGWPDPDHYSTARDLAIVAERTIRDFPEYYKYYAERDFTFNGIKQGNRNPLLYKNSGADGIKTGHTDEAGFGLTVSVKRGDRHIVMVATGLKSMKGRSQEAEAIVDFAFREFQNYPIVKQGDELDQADVWLGEKTKVPLVATRDLVVTLPRSARKDMKVSVSYDGPLQAPVAAGTVVGTLTVTAPDMQPQTVPIATAGDVAALGPMGRMTKNLEGLIWGHKS